MGLDFANEVCYNISIMIERRNTVGKYELTISKNYVPDWGVKEAIRELFQNALDQEIVDSNNSMFFAYDEDYLDISGLI